MQCAFQESKTDAFFEDALQFMVKSLRAQRALVIFGNPPRVRAAHKFESSTVLNSGMLSLSVLDQVRTEGVPLLTENAQEEPQLKDQVSVIISQVRSVICIPIWDSTGREVAGLIYGDSLTQRGAFTADHLERLVAYGKRLEALIYNKASKPDVSRRPLDLLISSPKGSAAEAWAKAKSIPSVQTQSPNRHEPPKSSPTRELRSSPGSRSLALFFRCLATMVKAGIPIHQALDVLGETGEDEKLRRVCQDLATGLRKGYPLSALMKKQSLAFSSFHVHLLRTGEKSGNLPAVLEALAEHQEKANAMGMRVRSALTYPMFLLAASSFMLVFGPPYLLKGQLDMIKSSGVEIPWITSVVMMLSDIVLWPGFIPLVLLTGFGLALAVRKARQSPAALRWVSDLLLSTPIIGRPIRLVGVTRFARSLAIQLGAGVMLTVALPRAAAASAQPQLAEEMKTCLSLLKAGETLADSLSASDFFPAMFVEMVKVGEETGDTAKIVNWTADFYDMEVEASLETYSATLEPLLMAGMGAMVAVILVATMLPMVKVIQLL